MEFLCPICNRSFSKPGDRDRHVKTKQDQPHQAYHRKQMAAQTGRISMMVNRLAQHEETSTTPEHGQLQQAVQRQSNVSEYMDVDDDIDMQDDTMDVESSGIPALLMDSDDEDDSGASIFSESLSDWDEGMSSSEDL
jgi:hypothetical protein